MKVSSSSGAARDAVSEFARIDRERHPGSAGVSAGASTVAGMHAAAGAADRVLRDLSALVSSVAEQAGKVSTLAALIEDRDAEDAGAMGRARESA